MKPSKQFQTGIAALAAAAFVTGCCGPQADRRTALHRSPGATQYQYGTTQQRDMQRDTDYSARTQTTTGTAGAIGAAQDTDAERTRVRETADRGTADWSLPLYSESLRVGKREVESGSVRLRKVVRTENVSQPVELRRETVVIDREAFDQARRAADAGQPNDLGAQFQEREIVIDLRREEPVVEVTPYVSGRVIAQKRMQTDRQNVQRQVRHEEVEIIKSGNERDIQLSERLQANDDRIRVRERTDGDANQGGVNQRDGEHQTGAGAGRTDGNVQ